MTLMPVLKFNLTFIISLKIYHTIEMFLFNNILRLFAVFRNTKDEAVYVFFLLKVNNSMAKLHVLLYHVIATTVIA